MDMKEKINNKINTKKEKGDNILNIQDSKRINQNNKQINSDTTKLELYNKVTQEDLKKLCDQLSAFNKRVQSAKGIIHTRYDLPFELRDKLEEEAAELDCLYAELQNAANSLDTIRIQRTAVSKEKQCLNTQLSKLKADAIQEMEVIVSVYDANMMERWEAVKKSNSVQEAENFSHDVKGKLEAMKNLQVLTSQKLTDLKNKEKEGDKKAKKEKKNMTNSEAGINGPRRSCMSNSSNVANSSQLSLSFLLDTDSEDTLDDSAINGVLYNLVCEQVLNMPPWSEDPHSPADVD